MKKETYVKIREYFETHSKTGNLLKFLYTALPVLTAAIYSLIIIHNALNNFGHSFILSVIIPAVTLLGVIVLRKIINRPRPYEKFLTEPFIKKNKKAQSFPSNHAASAFVIALMGFSVHPVLGFSLIFIAILISLSRIFSGVHFISDVMAGTIIGILMGSLFFFI